jgi:hypothetical protein
VTDVERGDSVRYVDNDGNEYDAIVLEPLPDDSYVTVARTKDDDMDADDEYVGPWWEIETSVDPHAEVDEDIGSTNHCYRLGWED